MSRNLFRIGEAVRLEDNFTDTDALDVDPTTVTLKLISPSGTQTSYTYAAAQITRSSTGHYYMDYVPAEAGPWRARWEATGYADARQITFDILPTEFS